MSGISGVYYAQIVSLMDSQIGRDEDQCNTEQAQGRWIMKEQATKKPITFTLEG
jgi:hypothetical protein